jgi:hypothetical protein
MVPCPHLFGRPISAGSWVGRRGCAHPRYDHTASHDIETDPDWRSRGAPVTFPPSSTPETRPSPDCPRPPTPSQPHCLTPSGTCSLAKTTGPRLRPSSLSWSGSCGRSPRDRQGECSASHNGRPATRRSRLACRPWPPEWTLSPAGAFAGPPRIWLSSAVAARRRWSGRAAGSALSRCRRRLGLSRPSPGGRGRR